MLKSEAVEKHPLERSSSSSSCSSLEFDCNTASFHASDYKKSPRSFKAVQKPEKRLPDLLHKSDDDNKLVEGSSHHRSASLLWQNRPKILNNLKKQATETVRSLTQSSSLEQISKQGFFYKSNDDSVLVAESPKSSELPSCPSGLLKVKTESISENLEDNDVSSFLHGFNEPVYDPLQILQQKVEQEKRKQEELAEETETRVRSFTALPVISPSSRISKGGALRRRKPDDISPKRKTDSDNVTNSYSVSLSALIAGKNENLTGDEAAVSDEIESLSEYSRATFASLSDNLRCKSAVSPEDLLSNVNRDIDEEPEVPEGLSPKTLFYLALLVYFYFVLPVPYAIHFALTSFMFGCIFMSTFLCIFAARSSRPKPFLPMPAISQLPQKVPKTLFDPDKPIKGWMNEISFYNPDTYHVSSTRSVFITLDGSTLRLQTPKKSIPRRSVYNEGVMLLTNVIHQRMFDITFAKVYLRPPGLVRKRVWSKKYPICVEIPPEKSSVETSGKSNLKLQTSYDSTKLNSPGTTIVYLFGRTTRQKEEWFYRIQRSINFALLKHKKSQKKSEKATSPAPLNVVEDWHVIEDHYEEETFLSSSVSDLTRINEEPMRVIQDYVVHVTRLFPEIDCGSRENIQSLRNTKADVEKSVCEQHNFNVAWLNVLLGRVMFDFLRQPTWAKWVSTKIQKKLDKIKLPYFMDELKLIGLDLGSSAPIFHEISQPKFDPQGIWFEAEVTYSGTAQMTLETKLVLTKLGKNETNLVERERSTKPSDPVTNSDAEDSAESSEDEDESAASKQSGKDLVNNEPTNYTTSTSGPVYSTPPSGAPPKRWIRIVDSIAKSKYFRKAAETQYIRKKLQTVSDTPVELTVELLQLKGILVINIAPAPTDRVWYGFREPPVMLLKAHPKVGERVVKTTHVTDWIEHKLEQELTKALVVPNMEDIPIPTMYHNRPPS